MYSSRRSRVARRSKKLDRSRVILKTHKIYPIRRRARADLPKPPQTVVALVPKVGSVGKNRGAVAAKPFCCEKRSCNQAPGNARRYSEKVPVVPHQFASGGTDGWFGGAGLECPPSSAISRGEKAGGLFPASRTVQRDVSYITAMIPPRPRTDWCPVIFSISSR